jgi:hypothetical protein
MSLVIVCLSAPGCDAPPYQLAPVHGTVTLDGQPLSGANVMFAPRARGDEVNAGKPAFGQLQPDGSYVLGTYDDEDGAVVGEHSVTIIRVGGGTKVALPQQTAPNRLKFSRLPVPGTFAVAAGQDNQLDIAITSNDVARYGQFDD